MTEMVDDAETLIKRIFPICRSITGDGVRQTLSALKEFSDFEIKEIPSGTKCYDWVVPSEWNIKDAYIEDSSGKRIIDFKNNNLHIVNYSIPQDKILSFQELEEHLHTLPQMPNAFPYRTTYYKKNWGFCISHNQFKKLDRNEKYHIKIDSSLNPKGSLTYGEYVIKGDSSDKEFLISTYCCHPSLANDNVSGQVLWTLLLQELKSRKMYHSYRFIIIPETIGAIAYLNKNEKAMKGVSGGFVITSVAGKGNFGYKRTYLGNHLIDRVVEKTFKELNLDYIEYPFDANGSDERQFSSPNFRIPVGTICKDKYCEYDYYHTSFDNLEFISASNLVETLKLYLMSIEKLEMNVIPKSLNPCCEPMLSKRSIYPTIGGQIRQRAVDFNKNHKERRYEVSGGRSIGGNELDAMRWVMFHSDGETSLMEIAEKTGFSVEQLYETTKKLEKHKLIKIQKK